MKTEGYQKVMEKISSALEKAERENPNLSDEEKVARAVDFLEFEDLPKISLDLKLDILRRTPADIIAMSFKEPLTSRIKGCEKIELEFRKMRERYNLPLEEPTPSRTIVIDQLKNALSLLVESGEGEDLEKVQEVFSIGIALPEGIDSISFEEVFPKGVRNEKE